MSLKMSITEHVKAILASDGVIGLILVGLYFATGVQYVETVFQVALWGAVLFWTFLTLRMTWIARRVLWSLQNFTELSDKLQYITVIVMTVLLKTTRYEERLNAEANGIKLYDLQALHFLVGAVTIGMMLYMEQNFLAVLYALIHVIPVMYPLEPVLQVSYELDKVVRKNIAAKEAAKTVTEQVEQ